ncbi:nucleotide kinase domain-containing protein [Terriglobus albidus]|uniref:nucleotide kinase domain-containing protein n=1 Tax=Terriglobus albidus TaxID=1592106 RepID=UPI0021E05B43|nr:nucleotide kinase domain-containing protein [Terriglobus albidus]
MNRSFEFPAPNSTEVSRPQLTLKFAGRTWKTTAVFASYWYFAAERQQIFFRRLERLPNLTGDPILQSFKFTNAYRASDRVSQFLIRHVIYGGDQSPVQLFFRIVLFKLFNKIETWEVLSARISDLSWRPGILDEIDLVLSEMLDAGSRIYSAAYIMPSGGKAYTRKHRAHLVLLEKMMTEGVWRKVTAARSMEQVYDMLLSQPMLGSFLAYQLATDLNYSTLCDFSEREFVVPGPGARDGLRKCFPDLPMALGSDAIKAVCNTQEDQFAACGLQFRTLWGRQLQLVDCQNLFCEIDKYSRIAHPEVVGISGRTRIKQQFRMRGDLPKPFYPPKWGLHIHCP